MYFDFLHSFILLLCLKTQQRTLMQLYVSWTLQDLAHVTHRTFLQNAVEKEIL